MRYGGGRRVQRQRRREDADRVGSGRVGSGSNGTGWSDGDAASRERDGASRHIGGASGHAGAGGYRAEPALEGISDGPLTGLYPIPGDAGFAYLLEKSGTIRQVSLTENDRSGQAQVRILDLSSRLIQPQDTEEGLLGLAFAPDFATSRKIYVNYTQGNPRRDTVSRFVVPLAGEIDVSTEEKLIEIDDFAPNHNGGGMEFGPDGMLYIGFGDGGGGGDPRGNGQNTDALLGKILRIDVSGDGAYAVPPDNPFAGQSGKRGEIWAYGFRNPWRFDFDNETGALWVADVGQGTWEEVDEVTKGGNYGWNIMEGPVCYKPSSGCDQSGLILPRASYSHDDGSCSITGGYVYRGRRCRNCVAGSCTAISARRRSGR